MQTDYDYIIAGAGLAGRSLALHLVKENALQGRKILIADQSFEERNDKTWCFWEQENSIAKEVIFREWKQVYFHTGQQQLLLPLAPYRYKMIRSADYYRYTNNIIANTPEITTLKTNIREVSMQGSQAVLDTGSQKISGRYIFSSIPVTLPPQPHRYNYLLQHFKGWIIKTNTACFQPETATLMDFRTSQQNGTSFLYVLPIDEHTALIEYTIFSKNTIPKEAYESAIQQYIDEHITRESYLILHEENGIIPMTDHPPETTHEQIIYTGAAGGMIKGSSGYAFHFIQEHSRQIAQQLAAHGKISRQPLPWRFRMYDSILLEILQQELLPGKEIFSRLFEKNKPQTILKFLDNQTNLGEELRLFLTLQKRTFLTAAIAWINKSRSYRSRK
ncbi:lycopene cyclase family protein [Chitinophaga arvensicola]|uniref:Lycopene beta-cyclase n=1 Tax=Chitinophaga arvensicola TaxID=29529 RepID=A0A1I0R6J6_9BACT|nr:lycopene cyclase family protein [Chitinophaga arvensicola]SEW36244.1 lycopene beta-cyclase [Chitinophaga arvensicola]